jgi:hypothetical protein
MPAFVDEDACDARHMRASGALVGRLMASLPPAQCALRGGGGLFLLRSVSWT